MQQECLPDTGLRFPAIGTFMSSRHRSAASMVFALTSSPAGSPARPSRAPARDGARPTRAGSGRRWFESFACFGPDGCLRKTSADCSLPGMEASLPEFCETWPTAGIVSDGHCYALRTSDTRTGASGCSSSGDWPTARAEDSESCGNHPGAQDSLTGAAERQFLSPLPAPATSTPGAPSSKDGRGSRPRLNPAFVEWLMGVPFGWTETDDNA